MRNERMRLHIGLQEHYYWQQWPHRGAQVVVGVEQFVEVLRISILSLRKSSWMTVNKQLQGSPKQWEAVGNLWKIVEE